MKIQVRENETRETNLLAPLGKGIKAEHPLLGLEEELEDVELLLVVGLVGGFGLLDELFEGEEGVISNAGNEGREVDGLLP